MQSKAESVEKPAIVAEATPEVAQPEPVKQEEVKPVEKPKTNREIVIFKTQHAFGGSQVEPMVVLVNKESGFNNYAKNPKSTAYGIGQFLDSTWKNVGCRKTSDPEIQVDCMIKYIKYRYGTPSNALKFHQQNNWY